MTALIPWRREEREHDRSLPAPPDPVDTTPEPLSVPQAEPSQKPSASHSAGLPRSEGSVLTFDEADAPVGAADDPTVAETEQQRHTRHKNIHPDITVVTVGLSDMMGDEAIASVIEEGVGDVLEAPRRRWLSRARNVADAPPSEEPLETPVGERELDATLAALFGMTPSLPAPPVVEQRTGEPEPEAPEEPVAYVEPVEPPDAAEAEVAEVVERVEEPAAYDEPALEIAEDLVEATDSVEVSEPALGAEALVDEPEAAPELEPEADADPAPEPAPEPVSLISDPTLAALFGPAAHWPEPTVEAEPKAELEPEPAPEPVWEPPVFLAPAAPEPEHDLAATPYAEPEALIEPEPEALVEPEPEALVEPEPEATPYSEPEPEALVGPEPQALVEPEPQALVEPEPEPEPEPAAVAESDPEPPVAKVKRRRRWRRGRHEDTAAEVDDSLTLDANVAAFFGLTDLQPDAAAGAAPSAHVEEVPLAEVLASEVSAVVAPEAESPEAEAVEAVVAPDDEVVAEPDHETHPASDLDAEVAAFFGIVAPDEEQTVEAEVEAPAESPVEPETAEEPKKRGLFRRKKKTADPEALEDPSAAELAALFGLAEPEAAAEPEAVDGPAEAFVDDVQAVDVRADDVPVEEGPRPKRRRLRRKKATAESTSPEASADEAADDLTPELAALFGAAEPVLDEPAAAEPVVDEPVADEPVVDEPAADEVDNQPEDAAEAEPEAQPETEAQPEAEDDLHVVVVPEEDSADFVAGFLRDVSVLRHGTVPATDAPIAAADDPVEVIDPKADPEDSPPEDWVPEHRTRTRRQRKRAARANAIPVVRAPKLRRQPTRTQKVAKGLAVVGFLCVCAAAPFLVPSIPSTISDLFPDGAPTSPGIDPALDPSSGGFNGPVGIQQPGGPLAGRALASAGDPLEVQVPRLKVDSQVVPISGQTGELLPPDDPQVLGWWQEGRGVGAESGSAVVTGHTVHTGGGAFDHLGQLVAGDRIRVRTKTGWIGYVVQRSRVYSTATLARDAASIFALQGPGRLVLITCSDFNGQIYLSNSVVYAVPVLDQPFVDAPIAKPTKKPTKASTEQPRIPYVPPSTPNLPSTPRPTHTSVPNSGPSANPTGIAGNTGPSGGVTPTEPPF